MCYEIGFKFKYLISLFAILCAGASESDAAAAGTNNTLQVIQVNHTAELAKYLQQSSVLYGLITSISKVHVEGICLQQLQHLQQQILQQKLWALKVLDAAGSRTEGFTHGNNFGLGSRQLCDSLAITNHSKPSNIAAPFAFSYRMLYLEIDSPVRVKPTKHFENILQLGLCVPTACTLATLEALATDYFTTELHMENRIFSTASQVLGVRDLSLNDQYFEKRSLRMACAYLIFAMLMFICAACIKGCSAGKAPNCFVRFVRCFDLQANLCKLFAINQQASKDILVINGLHTVSAIVIVFLHIVFFSWFSVNNPSTLRWYYQKFSIIVLIVDVFFTIGGFLRAYHFLNNGKQLELIRKNNFLQNVGLFIKMLIQRLLRIAPGYYFLVLLGDAFFTYMYDVSVFYSVEVLNIYRCSRSIWPDFFFMHNLFSSRDICLNWTWFLACEMQFFVYASVLLIYYVKNPQGAKKILYILLLGNILLTFDTILRKDVTFQLDDMLTTAEDIYANSPIRCLPYVLGVVLGVYLRNSPQLTFSIFRRNNFYIFFYAVSGIILYGSMNSSTSKLAAAIVYVAVRCCIAVSVSYWIICDVSGTHEWLVSAMRANVFQHLSRVSYAVFLLNPLVIIYLYGLANTSLYLTLPMFLLQFPGILLGIYLLSILFVLLLEIPFRNLAELIYKKQK